MTSSLAASPASPASSAHRAYVVRTAAFMGIYTLVHLGAILGLFDSMLGRPAGWLVALAVALPVAGQIWATLRLMAESDEYVRAITAKCFILAAGATMMLSSAWGFGETYAAAPHVPGWLVYPIFWAIYAAVAPFIRSSR